MKKYKLIKKYPGSPELGSICKKDCNNRWVYSLDFSKESTYYTLGHPKFYPEFWKEIVKKDYQILSFKQNSLVKDLWTEFVHGWCRNSNGYPVTDPYSYDDILNNHLNSGVKYHIHSVKRLSDSEVFTVGDRIKYNGDDYTIKEFKINNNKLEIYLIGIYVPISIKQIQHIKQPLFTTEDGVDIFKKDRPWYVSKDKFKITGTADLIMNISFHPSKNYLYFSTKEAAEEYILMNKPCLSAKDILKRFRWLEIYENIIKELVKEKQDKSV